MSSERDELRRLVDELPEDQVASALVEVRRHLEPVQDRPWPPAFFGAGTSRTPGAAMRSEELLGDGFGRP